MPLYTSIKGPINYTVAGNPTIEDGIVTNLSTMYNYLILPPINFINNDIDYVLKYSYSEDATNYRNVLLGQFGSTQCQLYISYDGDLIGFYMNGVQVTLSNIRIENYTYFRFLKKGTNLTLALSNDGINWDKSITHTSINWKNFQGDTHLGESTNVSEPNRPNFITLDLNESYINVNNTSWFGTSFGRVKINSGLARYSVIGNPTINDGWASNLSDSNYFQLNSNIQSGWKSIEFCFKINTGTDNNNNRYLISANDGTIMYMDHNGYPQVNMYWRSSGVGSALYGTGEDSFDGYVKYILTPTTAQGFMSTDGINWTLKLNRTGANYIGALTNIRIGKGTRSGGAINLNESYIKVNGSYFWRGSDYYQNLDHYKIHQDNFSKYYTIIDGKLTWANPDIYLETDGNAYIKLPYKINSRTTFDIKAYCPPNKSNSWFFGAGVSYMQSSMILYEYGDNSNTTYFYYKAPYIDGKEDTSTGIRQGVRSNSGNPLTYKSYISNDKYFLDVVENGVTYQKTTTGWNIPSDLGHNIDYTGLFATFNTNTSVLSPHKSGIRIYKAKLWNNGINNFNLVPVPKGLLIGNFVVPSNGMFDIVTQTFYGNAGTGEFEIGGIPNDYIIEGGRMIWCNPDISLENNSNWSAYINTGIIPTDDMRFQTLSEVTDSASHDGCLLGCRVNASTGTTGKQFVLWYGNYSSNINAGALVYGGSAAGKCNFNLGTLQKTQLDYDGTYFYCNGTQITPGSGNVNKNGYSSTLSIYLFGFNSNGSIESRRFHGKVYEVALWSGSTILQYLVPVPKGILIGDKIAPSNCMFDLVTQTFFENQGTGEFTIGGLSGDYVFVGDDVVWCNDSIYIKSSTIGNGKGHFIDTNYYPSNNTRTILCINNEQRSYGIRLFGEQYSPSMFRFGTSVGTKWLSAYGSQGTNSYTDSFVHEKVKIDFDKNIIRINGITVKTYNPDTFKSTYSAYLLNINQATLTDGWDAPLYYAIIFDNDHLMRYFIPVTTNMQISGTTIPAPGMWDMVTKKYFPNKGTGSFTYGKES